MMPPASLRPRWLEGTLLIALLGLSAAAASAQCPDGTPPPCRGSAAAAMLRRVNPQLSQRTWIVVPFTNATRTPDLDWLRDASVNLLTLDLGQWSDIKVVDDKHVGDLVRELPPARIAQPLTLNDGVAIARRAGAGRLVMGDYFRIGKGARFIVNVFACEGARALVAHDSLDVEAIYTVGECEYHGGRQIGEPVDSTHGRFRGNWNRAISNFRRVLVLDPTYHPAFGHVLDMLSVPMVVVCPASSRPGVPCGNDPATWVALNIREGDSLEIHPVRVTSSDFGAQLRRATTNRSRVLNLQAARRIAEDWVEASQHGPRALLNLGQLDIQLGELAAADSGLRQIGNEADRETRVEALEWRLQIAAQRADGPGGLEVLELLRQSMVTQTDSEMYASHAITFGKLQPIYAVIRRLGADGKWPPERVRYLLHVPRIVLGIPDERIAEDERAFWLVAPGDSVCAAGLPSCRTSMLLPSLAYATTLPRSWWPPMSLETWGVRFEIARGLALHDKDLVMKSLSWMDSTSRADIRVQAEEGSLTAIALDGALAIGDSSRALRAARFATDTVLPHLYNSGVGAAPGGAVYYKAAMAPRLMLRRAELEAAIGSRDDTRVWYDRVLSLWSDADPEMQPTVARIRAARAALGPPRG